MIEFNELEKRLAGRDVGEPSSELRWRIAGAVAAELASAPAVTHRENFWRFAAAAAVALIVGGNLAVGAASVTRFVEPVRPTAVQIAELDSVVRRVNPQISPQDARQIALLTAAASEGGGELP